MMNRIVHWLALLGFTIHESEKPRVPGSERRWGPPHNGFALSAHAVLPDLSLALKNLSGSDQNLQIRDWTAFYVVHTDAPESEYGRLLIGAATAKQLVTITLKPGTAIETDIPLDRLFTFERERRYLIDVTCKLGVTSNTVEIVL